MARTTKAKRLLLASFTIHFSWIFLLLGAMMNKPFSKIEANSGLSALTAIETDEVYGVNPDFSAKFKRLNIM